MVVAGDDYQAIYTWAGSNPLSMRDYYHETKADLIFLEQSYRVPRLVHGLATKLMDMIPETNRITSLNFKPTPNRGDIHEISNLWEMGIDPNEDTLIVYHFNRTRFSVEEILLNRMVPYYVLRGRKSDRGAFYSPATDAIRATVVVAMARSRERLDALAAEALSPGRVVPVTADASDDVSMAAAAARVLAERGVPDVVVANAGMGLDARFVDTTDDAVREVFELNVLGVFRTLRPFVPGMTARGSGRLLIVSSAVGKRGIPSYSAYSASKFALHGLADALRAELSGTGVTVGVICPSTTRTEFQDRIRRAGPGLKRVRINSHSAESVAAAIVRMARSRRREIVLSPEAKLMTFLNAVAPGILDRILGRVLKGD